MISSHLSLEMMWQAEGSSIFTGVLYGPYYHSPPNFDFDTRSVDAPMVRNPASPEYNVPDRVAEFVEYLEEQVSPWGSKVIFVSSFQI